MVNHKNDRYFAIMDNMPIFLKIQNLWEKKYLKEKYCLLKTTTCKYIYYGVDKKEKYAKQF